LWEKWEAKRRDGIGDAYQLVLFLIPIIKQRPCENEEAVAVVMTILRQVYHIRSNKFVPNDEYRVRIYGLKQERGGGGGEFLEGF